MKTAVVILNFNGKHFLEKFLPDVIRFSGNAHIVVADNASTDGSVEFVRERFPNIELIVLDKNYGFAEGYNLALKRLEYEYFVLLNSDIQVSPNWLYTLETYLNSNIDVTALQPKILSYDRPDMFEYAGACGGFIDRYGYPFCRGRIFDTIERDLGQYNNIIDVMWASGACLMIRAKDFFEVGGLDSRFFAYQEEIDLCWRLKSRGKRIVCNPEVSVYHVGSGVLGADSPHKTYLNFRNNLILLYKNLPHNVLPKVLFIRFWLDYLASLQLLLKGKKDNAKSIWKARRDFAKTKHLFVKDREENIKKTITLKPTEVYKKLLLWRYYFLKKKKFSDL
ncbi:MAG: glycosyltransferase family 2 protein [Porphyromonadaceae bacterium]|nr:glycosyltransferase family 2 protein [Porphyromonadaceae bacterium]